MTEQTIERTIETYAQELDDWRADVVLQLDTLVRKSAPGVVGGIKWAQPVWESDGPFAFCRAAAKHITFGFWRGAQLEDPRGVLEGDGTKMRHVKIFDPDEIPFADLKRWIKQAVSLNHRLGDPTKG